MTLPNLITVARVALVPVIVIALIEGWYGVAFAVFVLAGVSDGVDGAIARLYDQHSDLGAILDPLADKVLLVSVFVVLGVLNVLPVWLVVMVVARDLVIVCGVALAEFMGKAMPMKPHPISKANTAAQIALAALVLAWLAWRFDGVGYIKVGVWITGGLTIGSLIAYTWLWIAHFARETPVGRETE